LVVKTVDVQRDVRLLANDLRPGFLGRRQPGAGRQRRGRGGGARALEKRPAIEAGALFRILHERGPPKVENWPLERTRSRFKMRRMADATMNECRKAVRRISVGDCTAGRGQCNQFAGNWRQSKMNESRQVPDFGFCDWPRQPSSGELG